MKTKSRLLMMAMVLAVAGSANAGYTSDAFDGIGKKYKLSKSTTADLRDNISFESQSAGTTKNTANFQDATGAQNLSNQSTVNVTRQASVGNSCTIGQLATNASGKLLSCENGVYSEALGSAQTSTNGLQFISDNKGKYFALGSNGKLVTSTNISKGTYQINAAGTAYRSYKRKTFNSSITYGKWSTIPLIIKTDINSYMNGVGDTFMGTKITTIDLNTGKYSINTTTKQTGEASG